MNTNNESLTKLGAQIRGRLIKIEMAFFVLAATGFVMVINDVGYAKMFLVLLIATLALFYFFRGYSLGMDKEATGIEKFFDYLISLAWCVVTIGILFRLFNWPGFDMLLLLGCTTIFIALPVMMALDNRKEYFRILNTEVIVRSLVLLMVGVLLLFTPSERLEELKVIDKPAPKESKEVRDSI